MDDENRPLSGLGPVGGDDDEHGLLEIRNDDDELRYLYGPSPRENDDDESEVGDFDLGADIDDGDTPATEASVQGTLAISPEGKTLL